MIIFFEMIIFSLNFERVKIHLFVKNHQKNVYHFPARSGQLHQDEIESMKK